MMRILLVAFLEISISFLSGKSLAAAALPNARAPRPPPAFFAFGDSIVDTGNNNNRTTLGKCNFPPYGMDFVGGKPTGRFCNGKIPSDFLAELLGVKQYLPAFLDPNLKTEDLLTGVSFASGGAGYDHLTSTTFSVISLAEQLSFFKDYKNKLTAAVGRRRAAAIVAGSVYLVICSSNDIANNYYSLPYRRVTHDVNSYTDLMINNASSFYQAIPNRSSSFYQDLYRLGARKIAVANAPPIGCVPEQRMLAGGLRRECSDSANQMAQLFNKKLSAKIDALNAQLPGFRLVYLDVYSILFDIIQNHSNYGFAVADKGCCGTGNMEVSILCNPLSNPLSCANVTEYVFWDSFHPTERTYEILVKAAFDKYRSKLL